MMDSTTSTQLIEADKSLSQVFRHAYCVQHSALAAPIQQQLLPNYEMLLVFNFGPDLSATLGGDTFVIKQTVAIGPLQKVLHYSVPPGADFIVVAFTLNGFYRLLGQPMDKLAHTSIFDPNRLLPGNCFDQLRAELAPMTSSAERVAYLSDYALLFVAPANEDTHTVLEGVALFANPAIDPVRAIAQTRQMTSRSVQVRFKTNLGFTAKELHRFLRFKKVVTQLVEQYPAAPDWTDLVFVHGYHDQSHLIRDFRQYMDCTPGEFIKQLAGQTLCVTKPGAYY